MHVCHFQLQNVLGFCVQRSNQTYPTSAAVCTHIAMVMLLPIYLPFPFTAHLCILSSQAVTFHIYLWTIISCLLWMSTFTYSIYRWNLMFHIAKTTSTSLHCSSSMAKSHCHTGHYFSYNLPSHSWNLPPTGISQKSWNVFHPQQYETKISFLVTYLLTFLLTDFSSR